MIINFYFYFYRLKSIKSNVFVNILKVLISSCSLKKNQFVLIYFLSGDKLAKLFAGFPFLYLSAGTNVALIIIGGSTSKMFYQILCGATCTAKPLTTVEWFLVFTSAAVLLSQLPNLNSIAGVSLIGAITAIGYCTLIWVVSVAEGRLPAVSYKTVHAKTQTAEVFSVLNALGIVAFAFRGHNLVLEIQVHTYIYGYFMHR